MEICKAMNITKFDFGKKVHNLRNQFNNEMKKLENRIEQSGEDSLHNFEHRCKWFHFDSLLFLQNVIEPRPGGISAMEVKKRFKFDNNCSDDGNDDVPDHHSDTNFHLPGNSNKLIISSSDIPSNSECHRETPVQIKTVMKTHNNASKPMSSNTRDRDQWDAFGELVADEFRNLNSDISRKKLKRKLMQAILEVGDQDDLCL